MEIPASRFSLLKIPSGWLPLALSGAAIVWLMIFLLFVPRPAIPPTDEGVGAHVFQLLMGAQIPIVGYFLLRWLPRLPRQALPVLALHLLGWVAAFAPVYWLEHHAVI